MDELIHAVQPFTTTRLIKKRGIVLYQSEVPRSAFIVKKGLIRAYTITSSGEERTISLHAKNEIFPLSWIYGETPNTLFYFEAVTDSELLCIPKKKLLETVMSTPALMLVALKFTVNSYTALLLRVTALEQSSAAEKIALTLYYLLIKHGIQKKPGLYTIDIKMTQSMIASLVGLTRESAAVNLKLLKKKKVLTYSNFSYVINKQNLERFVSEDSFKNLSLN
ncbi:MAG: Crp/Fnr family transcriptional regulator [Candidatus Saccharibacteria bacterium]